MPRLKGSPVTSRTTSAEALEQPRKAVLVAKVLCSPVGQALTSMEEARIFLRDRILVRTSQAYQQAIHPAVDPAKDCVGRVVAVSAADEQGFGRVDVVWDLGMTLQGYRIGIQSAFDLETAAIDSSPPASPPEPLSASSGQAGVSSGRAGATSGGRNKIWAPASASAASTRPGSAVPSPPGSGGSGRRSFGEEGSGGVTIEVGGGREAVAGHGVVLEISMGWLGSAPKRDTHGPPSIWSGAQLYPEEYRENARPTSSSASSFASTGASTVLAASSSSGVSRQKSTAPKVDVSAAAPASSLPSSGASSTSTLDRRRFPPLGVEGQGGAGVQDDDEEDFEA